MNSIENNALNKSDLYNNLGYAYMNQEEYEKAKEYLEKSLRILEESGLQDSLHMVDTYSNFVGNYAKQGKSKKSVFLDALV